MGPKGGWREHVHEPWMHMRRVAFCPQKVASSEDDQDLVECGSWISVQITLQHITMNSLYSGGLLPRVA